MVKTSSPYIYLLPDKEIDWKPLNQETLNYALEVNKPIFFHIGYIGNIQDRDDTFKLFSDPNVARLLNNYFVPVIVDSEEFPEFYLMGVDLLNLNNIRKYNPINIFALSDFRPVSAVSQCPADDFILIACNLLEAMHDKPAALDKLANTTISIITKTGILSKVDKLTLPLEALLDKAVGKWVSKYTDHDSFYKKIPFSINIPYIRFLANYYSYAKNDKIDNMIRPIVDRMLNTAAVDPIDGGVFSEMEDVSCEKPLFEKSLTFNIQTILFLIDAYEIKGAERYKKAALRIYEFIENEMRINDQGYMCFLSLYTNLENSIYYTYTLKEIKSLFPKDYERIAAALGMNLSMSLTEQQLPKNSVFAETLTPGELKILRKRRKEHPGFLQDTRQMTFNNAGMVKALCRLATISENREYYITRATELHKLLMSSFHVSDFILSRSIVADNSYYAPEGNLMDYASFIEASYELYELTGNNEYAHIAQSYLDFTIQLYYKPENGMFTCSNALMEMLTYGRESNLDTPYPSANSIMCSNLIRQYRISGEKRYYDIAKQQVYNVSPHLLEFGNMLSNWCLIILDIIKAKIEIE